jgi:hypothetical protein
MGIKFSKSEEENNEDINENPNDLKIILYPKKSLDIILKELH